MLTDAPVAHAVPQFVTLPESAAGSVRELRKAQGQGRLEDQPVGLHYRVAEGTLAPVVHSPNSTLSLRAAGAKRDRRAKKALRNATPPA